MQSSDGGDHAWYGATVFSSNDRTDRHSSWACAEGTLEEVQFRVKPGVEIASYDIADWLGVLQSFPLDQDLGEHSTTLTLDVAARYRSWLVDCESQHALCNAPANGVRPARLLEVTGTSDEHIQLVPGHLVDEGYVALSYCWGKAEIPILTKARLQDSKLLPRIKDLPLLYRGVMRLLSVMQIRHLWIDSLCIVQDDDEHRDREIRGMGSIYGNARFVIVAAMGHSPYEGLFEPRSSRGLGHMWYDCLISDAEEPFVQIRRTPLHGLGRSSDFRSPPLAEPVSQRSWTFQERLMARRCLTFTSHETPIVLDGSPIQQWFESPEVAELFWWRAVKEYAGRSISKPADYLPAISTLAAVVCQATQRPYLAGHLDTDRLIEQLCWEIDTRTKLYWPTEHGYVAPSWSWASSNASIIHTGVYELRGPGDTPSAQVTSAECVAGTTNSFGAVKSGHIVLRARVCAVMLHVQGERHQTMLTQADPILQDGGRNHMTAVGPTLTTLEVMGQSGRLVLDGSVAEVTSAGSPVATLQIRIPASDVVDEEAISTSRCGEVFLLEVFRRKKFLVVARSVCNPDAFVRLGMLHYGEKNDRYEASRWVDATDKACEWQEMKLV
ncbi:hypothetical protein LTR78_004220 [Recurvomyces mirabilis]|uniref:Heterokaryon incompatibility domain-containing protein n=1 Tax=Recurvomyces mirabilis TaxID=574656 RepID=A0AAE0WQC0_9PEZI|nr:hypothetical protein LTR78_004220 [Recurvomyces mirabilis]KAK5153610.1 hypothetical protein LTS14_007304 [Recurvomyces mirabilis]